MGTTIAHLPCKENPTGKYTISVLIRHAAFRHDVPMFENYFDPLVKDGADPQNIVAWSLEYNDQGKAPVKLIRAHLATLLPNMAKTGTELIICADAAYFKVLAKKAKAEAHHGYVLPCAIEGFENMNVILSVNYRALFHNPNLHTRLDMSMDTAGYFLKGAYVPPGKSIIHSEHYPVKLGDISNALDDLHQYDEITCDIEAFSLQFNKAGLATIAFAWNQHEGIAFAVDYENSPEKALKIKRMLKQFFIDYQGKIIYHNATYDIKILIYELWMKHI